MQYAVKKLSNARGIYSSNCCFGFIQEIIYFICNSFIVVLILPELIHFPDGNFMFTIETLE